MALPTKRMAPKLDPNKLMVLIYGPTGIGKSTFCHRVGKILFIPTDPGLNALDVYLWNDQEIITTWEEIKQAYLDLQGSPGAFDAVCIDNVSSAHKLAANYMARVYGVKHETDIPGHEKGSKGYTLVNNEFLRVMRAFRSLGIGLYLTAHTKDRISENKGVKTTQIVPDLPDKSRNDVVNMCDFVFYACAEDFEKTDDNGNSVVETKHILRTNKHAAWEAKDRFGFLPPVMQCSFPQFKRYFIEGMKKRAEQGIVDEIAPEPSPVPLVSNDVKPKTATTVENGKAGVVQSESSTVKSDQKAEPKSDVKPDPKAGAKLDTKPDTKSVENAKK